MKIALKAHKLGISALAFAAALSAGSGPAAQAAEEGDILGIPGEFSANVAFTTDYRFRGITQSDDDPALQGGLDYSVDVGNDFGIYLGAWASSVNFNDGDEASIELDYYGGVTANFDGIGVDFGLIYYTYPGASSSLNYDYLELKADLSYSPVEMLTVGVGYNYSPDYFASSGNYHYPHAAVELTPDLGLPVPLTLDATFGYNFIDDKAAFGAGDYADWTVGIGTSYKILTFKLQYVDNNLSGSVGDAAVVFTVGAAF